MPVNKSAIARYQWIDQRLRNKRLPKPSLGDLVAYVSEKIGRPIAVRTIQEDLRVMRHEPSLNYQAPIAYDRAGKHYYYTDPHYSIGQLPVDEMDLEGLEIAIGILEQFRHLPLIRQFEDAMLRIADALQINRERLETQRLVRLENSHYKGAEYIREIMEAIKQKEVICIKYQSFGRTEPKEHWVEPYHLRGSRNYLYLVGKSIRIKEPTVLTFALDRIVALWPTDKKFETIDFDEAAYFKDVIGITHPNKAPERILLSFSPTQAHYVKTQPLHHSQLIVQDDDTACLVQLKLVINHELFMLLLSYGSQVKVLEPDHLAQKLKAEAEAMLRCYL